MLCKRKVYNTCKEPGRVNLPGTFTLSAFVRERLIFERDTLTYKKSSRKFEIVKFLRFID